MRGQKVPQGQIVPDISKIVGTKSTQCPRCPFRQTQALSLSKSYRKINFICI